MVYGYYITDTTGEKRFFVEGCSYCRISTGGQHEDKCPLRELTVAERLQQIRNKSMQELGAAWEYLANH